VSRPIGLAAMTSARTRLFLAIAFSSLLTAHSLAVAATATVPGAGVGPGSGLLLQSRTIVKGGSDADSSDTPPPACSCDCCDVVARRPGEVAFGAGVKCSPNTDHSPEMCGLQCAPAQEDRVLPEDVVDTQRFCFFECKPAAGTVAPENSQCVALAANEAARVIDPAGNPMDPAFLYGRAPALFNGSPMTNLLSTQAKLKQHEKSPDVEGAKEAAVKGKALSEATGKDARMEAARLRGSEEQQQNELNMALKDSSNGVVTMDSATAIARVAAEKATASAAAAVQMYDQGQQKMKKLALSDAAQEVLNWQKHAVDHRTTEAEMRAAGTWRSRAIEKAQQASKPYVEGMLRAQESAKLYNEKGFALANEATALSEQWQTEAAEANKLPRSSAAQTNIAQAAMLDAREKAVQAQSLASQSKQYFATAAEVSKSIPQYQYSAQKAAAMAVAAK